MATAAAHVGVGVYLFLQTPWAAHGVCHCVCLLYPPIATADYTCDGDGVPENPERRALFTTCAQNTRHNPLPTCWKWPSRDMDLDLRFTHRAHNWGSMVVVSTPWRGGGRATRYERARAKDLEIRLTGGARFAFFHSAGSSQSGTAL